MNDFTRKETHLDTMRLHAVIEPVVRAHGGEVVAIEWKQEPGGWVLRVFVEKEGSAAAYAKTADAAVSLELCAGVARDLSPALDVADVVPHRYSLEVSSPGVERVLRDRRDYVRFVGEKAKLRLSEPVEGQKVMVGVLEALPDGAGAPAAIGVRDGSRLFTVPFDQIASGRLVFEFGPAPKPKPARGKAGSAAKQAKVKKARKEEQAIAEDAPEETSNS